MAVRVPTLAAVTFLPTRRFQLASIAAAGAIALAACGSASPSTVPSTEGLPSGSVLPGATASASSGRPTASDAPSASAGASPSAGSGASLLLEVRHVGGFINPAATIGAPSAVVVDTDGRIYTPHPSTDGTGPLIPRIDVRDTGAAGAAAILAAAHDAGLDAGTSTGIQGDAGSTVFTLETPDGREIVTRVGSMGAGGSGVPGAPGGPSGEAGSAALSLLAKLTDDATPWPPSATPATVLVPTAYELWVAPEAAGSGRPAGPEWPLAADPNLFGSPVASNTGVAGLRSGEVSGDQALGLATALHSVAAGSDLSYQGHPYRVWVRPLLPDELGG